MDTKLRKSHKLAKVIIALCVILPAILLVSLYPKMETEMLRRKQYYEGLWEKHENEATETTNPKWVVDGEFTNYAVEASYYIYAKMLSDTTDDQYGYFEVLTEYGWDADYHLVCELADYTATYNYGEGLEPIVDSHSSGLEGSIGTFTIIYDANGLMTDIYFEGDAEFSEVPLREVAENSHAQYNENSRVYAETYNRDIESVRHVPKNLKVEFTLYESTYFVSSYDDYYYDDYYYISNQDLFVDVGMVWIVALCVIFVIFAALLLPLIKPLNTGREKLFSLPLEIMFFIGFGAFLAVFGMCSAMAQTTLHDLKEGLQYENLPEILGYAISVESLYNLIRGAECIGWAISFFLVYIVVSAIRQFVIQPIQYLKNQTLTAGFYRWVKKKCKKLCEYIADIDINNNLERSIIKIVVANFVVVSLLCCLWFGGALGAVIYSILLFILLKKYGQKIQKQYHSILHATEQMADGDLKISLDEDLGVFTPIGMSLEEVQQGFEKAVVEEAKSQNMKTELITNVSHDLKTPLTAIITYVDLLKKEDITEEERESYIATLDQKSQRLKVLIEDLFEVSKAHSGNVKMNFMNIDVVSLLKQVRSEMGEQIENSNLQFRWNLPDEKVNLSLDGQRTYRVFENLLNNILKYAMPYSRVYIDMISTESQVQIRFRNVSAMELDFDVQRLTERFVRGDSARNSEGSGLGLAIAKSFVELQNGIFKIEVDGDLFKVLITFDR